MSHLLDSLEAGKDIGHYGRLTFVMVARHYSNEEELISYLTKDPDCGEPKARALVQQVESRDTRRLSKITRKRRPQTLKASRGPGESGTRSPRGQYPDTPECANRVAA